MEKKAQIWVETVIYTLIGLSLIGVAIALITPKINETRDNAIVEQSIGALSVFDREINDVLESGADNLRVIETFSLRRGKLTVDGVNEKVSLVIIFESYFGHGSRKMLFLFPSFSHNSSDRCGAKGESRIRNNL